MDKHRRFLLYNQVHFVYIDSVEKIITMLRNISSMMVRDIHETSHLVQHEGVAAT